MQTNRLGIEKSEHVKAVNIVRKKTSKTVGTVRAKTPKNDPEYFVGIDLHKIFMQVALMDSAGNVLKNERIACNFETVRKEFAKIPANARYVLESSSVWYGMYRLLRDEMGLDVMLSNPLATKRIAQSKKKTDRVDAEILADLLRGGYIAECYVPDKEIVGDRQLVRYRSKMVRKRTEFKNGVHAILLQAGIKISGVTFTPRYVRHLHQLEDWRIEKYLKTIEFFNQDIADCDARIKDVVSKNGAAKLLKTMPGIGNITALAPVSEIGEISRFPDMDSLAAYFGLVPSVGNSASTVHHGRITKQGNSLMRHLLTEAALVHVIHARRKKSPTPLGKFYERLCKKRGGSKAKVATAAKMLRIAYWMLTKKMDYQTCIREGSKSTFRNPKNRSKK